MPGDSPSTTAAEQAAAASSDLSHNLRNTTIPGSGALSDSAKSALEQAQKHADILASSAKSLHQAVGRHTAAEATHRLTAPSQDEIDAAKEKVATLADKVANGEASQEDLDAAINSLSELLADKEAADKQRDDEHAGADDDLNTNASDLTDPAANPAMNQMPMDQMGQPQMSQPQSGGMPTGANPGPDPNFSSSPDFNSGYRGADPFGDMPGIPPDLNAEKGEGQTHLSGGEGFGSGRGSQTFVGGDPQSSSSRGAAAVPNAGQSGPRGNMPMGGMMGGGMPMGMGHGMGGKGAGGGNGGATKKEYTLIEDPLSWGQDIDDKYGTDGDIRGSSD